MKRRLFCLLIINLLVIFHVMGEDYILTGKISSSEGTPLPGATIQVKDFNRVTIAGDNGRYRLVFEDPGAYTIVITYVGFEKQEATVTIDQPQTTRNFTLSSSLEALREITVHGNPFKTGPRENSLTITTIDKNFLEENHAGSFAGMLEELPGINTINTGTGISKPVIRGLSFNRISVIDRGIRQEGQQWGADHGLEIDQFAPERVEIIKGPSSLQFGSDAMGGVIQIKPPPLHSYAKLEGDILTSYHHNNHKIASSAHLKGQYQDYAYQMRFSTQDYGDYRVPAESFYYNTYNLPLYDQKLKNTAGKERNFTFTLGTLKTWGDSRVTVSNFHQKAGLFPGATGIPRTYQLQSDGNQRDIGVPYQEVQHLKVTSNSTIDHWDHAWMELDLGYQFNDRQEQSLPHAHGQGPRPEGNLALGLALQTWSANLRLNQDITNEYTITTGIQGQWQENRIDGFEFLLPAFNSGEWGIHNTHEWSLLDHLSVNGGIRFDYGYRNVFSHQVPVYEDEETIKRYDQRVHAFHRDFYNFSGAAGLSWFPSNNFNLKLNTGSSFKMPTVAELGANGVHHGTFRHEQGDSTLIPERGFQTDVNITWRKTDFYFSISPFLNYFNNYIYFAPTSRFSSLPGGGQVFQYKQHDAIYAGGEASVSWQLLKNLSIMNTTEYVYNYNLDTQLPLPFTPPLSSTMSLEYNKETLFTEIHGLHAHLKFKWVADQNRVDRNERPTAGYYLLTFKAGAHIHVYDLPVNLNFSIQNLLNQRYMHHLSRYRLLNLPEPGRNFVVSLKIPFTLIPNE